MTDLRRDRWQCGSLFDSGRSPSGGMVAAPLAEMPVPAIKLSIWSLGGEGGHLQARSWGT